MVINQIWSGLLKTTLCCVQLYGAVFVCVCVYCAALLLVVRRFWFLILEFLLWPHEPLVGSLWVPLWGLTLYVCMHVCMYVEGCHARCARWIIKIIYMCHLYAFTPLH
jgi:hypothetical protein